MHGAQALAAGISRRERQQVEAIALLLLARARAPMPSFATTWSITHGICCCSEWRSASFRSAASGAGVASFPAPLRR